MTSAHPDDGRPDPLDGATDAEIDRRFAELVAGFSDPDDVWTPPVPAPEPAPTPSPSPLERVAEPGEPLTDGLDAAAERARRRELRRLEREAEYQFFLEQKAAQEAEREADQEHYTPPDPPPLPRPKRRTVGALLLIGLGLFLLAWPELLPAAADLVAVVGVLAFLAGSTLLFLGLRRRPGDTESGDGWDDGAEV